METLQNGERLRAVTGPQGPDGDQTYFREGRNKVELINVVMENGQMAGVPWAAITIGGKVKYKVNLALMEQIELF